MKLFTRLLPLCLLVLAASAAAAEEGGLGRLVAPDGIRSGDADAMMRAYVGFIEEDPEHPFVPLAMRGLIGVRSAALDDSEVTNRLFEVLERGIENGDNDERIRWYLRARLRERGEHKKGDTLDLDRGYLRRFAVAGPFGIDAEAMLDRPYAPERTLAFGKDYSDAGGDRRFLLLPRIGSGSRVQPYGILTPNGGVAYSVSQLKSETARPAVMRASTGGSLRVWLNGEEVLRKDRLRSRLPRISHTPVVLRKGWNRFLVKTVGNSPSFALRLLDGVRPIEGLVEETGLVLHEIAEPPSPAIVAGTVAKPEIAPADGEAAFAAALEAALLDDQGLDMAALERLKEAVALASADPALRHRLGVAFEGARELPEVWRKNRAKAEYARALEADPDYSPAAIRLALLLHADDKSEESVAALREVLEKFPGHLEARRSLARVCRGKGWEKEWLDEAKTIVAAAPRLAIAVGLVDYYDRLGNTNEVRRLLAGVLENDRSHYDANRRLITLDAANGDLEAAISRQRLLCELYPAHSGSQTSLATYLDRAGRTDEATALLRAVIERFPLNARFPETLGDMLRRNGDTAGALAAYRKTLELDPGRAALRRYVDRMTGGDEVDFAAPYETEVLDLIPGSPGREEYPRAPAVCLLDQTVMRVWPDGSSTEIVHMAYKILDEKGIEAFGTVTTGGETLEIRTVDPEGKIFEPIGVSRNRYNMPALAPGSVVEYRYSADTRRNRRSFDSGPFYFGDPDYDNAVLLSRWIVILPKELKAHLMLRNFEGKHEVREEGDLVVHVFEAENSPRVEKEPFMPGRDDLLPWARFFRNRPMDDVGPVHADRLWRGILPTALIEAEAAKVTEEVEGTVAKARALYAHVNELVTGSFSFGGPTATLIEKAGDRFDLLAALLLAADVEFELAMACPDRGEEIEWEFVEPGVFRQRCIRIEDEDGAPVWIFVGNRFTPFGRIPDRYRDSPALVTGISGPRIETLPPEEDSDHQNRTVAKITLAPERENVTVDVTLRYGVDGGYGFKESMKDRDTDDRRQAMEGWVSSLFTGPRLESFEFPDLEKPGTPARLTAVAKIPNFLLPEGEHLKVGLGISTLDLARTYIGKPERIHRMVIRSDYSLSDRTEIDLGGSYEVVSLPQGHVTLGALGAYSLSIEEEEGKILVRRDIRFRPAKLTKDEYKSLARWVKAIDEAEQAKILLRKTGD